MPSTTTDVLARSLESASEYAARELVTMIDLGRFAPGDRLPPADQLAAMLGVSRPVALQALAQLRQQGRVVMRRGSGARVSDLDAGNVHQRRGQVLAKRDEILEMCRVRELLEVALVRQAARTGLSRSQIAAGWQLIERMSETVDRTEGRQLDMQFHDLACGELGGPTIDQLIRRARAQVASTFEFLPWPRDRKSASDAGHQAILEAIIARDPDAAEAALRAHIAPTLRMVERFLGSDSGRPRRVPARTRT